VDPVPRRPGALLAPAQDDAVTALRASAPGRGGGDRPGRWSPRPGRSAEHRHHVYVHHVEVALVARSRPTPTASTRSRGTTSDAGCRTSPQLSIGGSIHDPGDPIGKMFFGMLALMAEFESDLIRSRTVEGMREAAKRGRLLGKPSKLSVLQRKRLLADYESGEYSAAQLMDISGLSRSASRDRAGALPSSSPRRLVAKQCDTIRRSSRRSPARTSTLRKARSSST